MPPRPAPPPALKHEQNGSSFADYQKKTAIKVKMLVPHAWCLAPPLPLPAAGNERVAIGRETSPHPGCCAWGEPPSARSTRLCLLGESPSQETTPHPAPPDTPWLRRRPSRDSGVIPALTRQLRLPSRRVCEWRGWRHC